MSMSVTGNSTKSRPNSNKKKSHCRLEPCSYSNSRKSDDVRINSLYVVFYKRSAALSDCLALTHMILKFNEVL